MNPAFFQQIETILATERLDAYRQDGVTQVVTLARYLWNMALCEALYSPLHTAILEVIGWITPELRQMALALDRFTTIRQQGLNPWIEKIRQHWPRR